MRTNYKFVFKVVIVFLFFKFWFLLQLQKYQRYFILLYHYKVIKLLYLRFHYCFIYLLFWCRSILIKKTYFIFNEHFCLFQVWLYWNIILLIVLRLNVSIKILKTTFEIVNKHSFEYLLNKQDLQFVPRPKIDIQIEIYRDISNLCKCLRIGIFLTFNFKWRVK